MDGNGDGVGDFAGLISRLDYLHSLGVDVLWLAPFQPSPNRDNGYDIYDYFGADARDGSSGDFVEFIQHAKKRGMRVILDLVVNHTINIHAAAPFAKLGVDTAYLHHVGLNQRAFIDAFGTQVMPKCADIECNESGKIRLGT